MNLPLLKQKSDRVIIFTNPKQQDLDKEACMRLHITIDNSILMLISPKSSIDKKHKLLAEVQSLGTQDLHSDIRRESRSCTNGMVVSVVGIVCGHLASHLSFF